MDTGNQIPQYTLQGIIQKDCTQVYVGGERTHVTGCDVGTAALKASRVNFRLEIVVMEFDERLLLLQGLIRAYNLTLSYLETLASFHYK